jgi:hypothetical protein
MKFLSTSVQFRDNNLKHVRTFSTEILFKLIIHNYLLISFCPKHSLKLIVVNSKRTSRHCRWYNMCMSFLFSRQSGHKANLRVEGEKSVRGLHLPKFLESYPARSEVYFTSPHQILSSDELLLTHISSAFFIPARSTYNLH